LLDPVLMLDGLVESELDERHAPEAETSADLSTEEWRGPLERSGGLVSGCRVAERRVKDARNLEVPGDIHPGERDKADARVADIAACEHLAQILTDLVADAVGAMSGGHYL
jgi:hypothetical protein